MTKNIHTLSARTLGASLAIASILLVCGCAKQKGASAGKPGDAPSTGLEALASANAADAANLEAMVSQQSSDLERILGKGTSDEWTSGEAQADTKNTKRVASADQSGKGGFGLEDLANTHAHDVKIAMPKAQVAAAEPSNDPLADAWASAEPVASPAMATVDTTATDTNSSIDGPSTGLANLASGMTPGAGVSANEPLPGAGPSVNQDPTPDLWPETVVTNDESSVREGGEAPLDTKVDQAAVGMMDLLRQQAAVSPDPLRPYLMLSVLEAMHPGASPQIISPDGQSSIPLSDDEKKAVESLRQVMAELSGGQAQAATISDLAATLDENKPLRVRNVQLCTAVRGYGQYAPVANATFIAGRATKVIVYAELEGFRSKEISSGEVANYGPDAEASGDTLAVELVQEVALYHDADGLRVWSTPESKIVETSRVRRRDFYTVHTIELPANLSVGSYKLKLVVRDATSGSVADVNVGIKVVAR